ncbi:hypothetical protein ACIAD1912 [Acinetobacter baylyi ADP1]|uniref:Uncharacterized protein n=1 Tax=Acinetobacter baylyi (strain ATCC 33305 / BD413 / ADP1) TaxID=62977 RepID=Q6FB23_ACIAD|nr:hypothetical protein ACIAD1912 [Acinetobacter baylyi ADP1]
MLLNLNLKTSPSPELNVIWALQQMLYEQSIRTDVVGRLTNFSTLSRL